MLTKLALYYADILEFHRRAYKFVRRKSWKFFFRTTWAHFKVRFDSIIKSMEYHSNMIRHEATTINIIEARQYREKLMDAAEREERDRNERQRLSVISWLGLRSDLQADEYERLLRDCLPGTCSWIRPKLEGWLKPGTHQSVTWIHGKPGAGNERSSPCIHWLAKFDI